MGLSRHYKRRTEVAVGFGNALNCRQEVCTNMIVSSLVGTFVAVKHVWYLVVAAILRIERQNASSIENGSG
jgi:hypothetical protein